MSAHPLFFATLVCCMDGRLVMANIFWLVRMLWRHGLVDIVANAGGVLDIIRKNEAGGTSLILDDLRTSIEKHGVRNIVLQAHRDCGAMPSFASRQIEYEHHMRLLRWTTGTIRRNFEHIELNIHGQWVEFVPDSAPQKGLLRKIFVFARRSARTAASKLGAHGPWLDILLPTGTWEIQELGLL